MTEPTSACCPRCLIGKLQHLHQARLMVTPRATRISTRVEDGERNTHDAEQAGRSLSTGLNGWMAAIQRGASGKSAAELAPEK